MAIVVRVAGEKDRDLWDRYVSQHPEGTFCHRWGWKAVLEEGAKQATFFLIAQEGDVVLGVLPLGYRNSLLFGKSFVSTPFCVYGGPLAHSAEAREALSSKAWELALSHGCQSLEFRTIKGVPEPSHGWHKEKGVAATFIKDLKQTPEEILLDIPRKQRAVVRKSLKNGLSCSWDHDLETFFALYAESVRNLGTPVFPKKVFATLLREFSEHIDIQVIRSPEGTAIASLMSFYTDNTVLPYYAGGSVEARKFGAHDFMYYQLMLRAAEKGVSKFDFGRSKTGTGPYKFKKNWGFVATPLEYEIRLADGASKPDLNPNSGKYALMVKMWKKMPLFMANRIGPLFSGSLG